MVMPENVAQSFFLLQMLMPVYQKTDECLAKMHVNDALVQANFGWEKGNCSRIERIIVAQS